MECVGEAKMKLSDEELSELRSNGVDIRRYLINIVRDLKIDIYKSLLELNSGPVVEESCNTENLRPIDFKCEFAGNEIEFANVPR
ncbi:hypothetical protein LSH36_148g06025 [Paralvinella palmiformis]|uniref:Uncharacterized protein n=1 Tax=Paralvinella palmiformis TaxID=53620 RepID=A0AAD9JVB8_9ANNE|nr:hypothetical protein LSH36_148g06025 [Paralvinella palmiformis]